MSSGALKTRSVNLTTLFRNRHSDAANFIFATACIQKDDERAHFQRMFMKQPDWSGIDVDKVNAAFNTPTGSFYRAHNRA
mgnify:CR=1 FL=1